MHGKPTTPALLFAIFALFCPLASQAADAWIEIKEPELHHPVEHERLPGA